MSVPPSTSPSPTPSPTVELDDKRIGSNQLSHSNGVYMSIVLTEPFLFLHGNAPYEYSEQSPAILRGSLVVKCTKPVKLKSIYMYFKGHSRTEWPEGIPPKKTEVSESNELHSHFWPFFNALTPTAEFSSGAHRVRKIKDSQHSTHSNNNSHHHHHHHISPSMKFLASKLKRHTNNNSSNNNSANTSPQLSPQPSSTGITSLQTSPHSSSTNLQSLNLAPHRSFSKDEPRENDAQTKGFRVFQPGEYIYNFELPIANSMPESISALYGSVQYYLEATVERYGTFKPNVVGRKDIKLVRAASLNNVETSEPITVSKDWEDQMHYDIVVGGKAFPLGTHIPIAMKFTPFAKVKCHRIRIYVTENVEYYCRDKKVHRVEPMRKYLLKEHLPSNGLQGTLINLDENTTDDLLALATEMEYQVYLPKVFGTTRDILHPNTTHEDIQVHHWLKIVLRLSKVDDTKPDKRRYFEIAIDSPITILHNACTSQNLGLPQYSSTSRSDTVTARSPSSVGLPAPPPPSAPSPNNDEIRPIHYIRMPSVAPPPFQEVDDYSPPRYETVIQEKEEEARAEHGNSGNTSRASSMRDRASTSSASLTHSQTTYGDDDDPENTNNTLFSESDLSEQFSKFKFNNRSLADSSDENDPPTDPLTPNDSTNPPSPVISS